VTHKSDAGVDQQRWRNGLIVVDPRGPD
jgi:hypothetical protein